ncbi:MAG: aminopeptidase P family protein [Rhizobacter sp.]|nr:aminopeptidase P family protein [Chlorobiales bacterium]
MLRTDESTTTLLTSSKLASLRKKMQEQTLDAMIITHLPNIRWLTNFSGSNAVLILTAEQSWLITDGRYSEQVKTEVEHAEPFITSDGYIEELRAGKFLSQGSSSVKPCRTGVQGDKLSYTAFQALKEALPGAELVPLISFCDAFIAVKDADELSRMKQAVAITDKVFDKLLDMISPDVTEREVAAEISYWNKRFGGEKDAFDPIVASGERGALPHARPSNEKIRNNSLVVIDMGCVVGGYCSDQTRTVAVGKISDEAKKIYNLVLEAHLLGIRSAKPEMTGKELDGIVREFFAAHGYGEAFGHSLGHSIGIEVHQSPIIGRKSETNIPAGSVITIEPGLYLAGKFGVRIEDMVYVTNDGATPLPSAPKQLIEL